MATRRAAAPPKPPEELPEEEAERAEDPAGGGDDAGGDRRSDGNGAGDAHLREIVREVVGEFLAGGGGGAGETEGKGGRLIDEERAIERRVTAELERVKAASDVESLREQVKAIVEKPPIRHRRSTRFMGWVENEDQ